MQSCIQDVEDILDAKCVEGHGSTIVDVARLMNNVAVVGSKFPNDSTGS